MTASPNTAARPGWLSVPGDLREAITARTGPVLDTHSPSGGFTPGLAVRLRLGSGCTFVKALPADHPLAGSYRHEAEVAGALPRGVPAPRLLWSAELCGWLVLAYDNAEGEHADLSRSGGDMPVVLEALRAARVTAPHGLPGIVEQREGWLHGWAELRKTGFPESGVSLWAADRIDDLAGAERHWLDFAAGSTLVHGDLRGDNILVGPRGAVFVDWSHASSGQHWPDLVDLVLQMILAGHSPESAMRAVPEFSYLALPEPAVTSYVAACAGYWTRSSLLPVPDDAPFVRAYQARAASAAIGWLVERGL